MSEPVCMWCDDGWPISADEPGCHEVEAEGQYATVPCHRPDEYVKYEARKREGKTAHELWLQACAEEKGYEAGNRRYVELMKEHGLIRERRPGDPETLPCGHPIGGAKNGSA